MTNAIHSLINYLRHKEIEIEDGQASFKHQIIQINYISYNITTYLKISPLRPSPVSTWELLMEYSKAMPNLIERRGWSGWESYIPSFSELTIIIALSILDINQPTCHSSQCLYIRLDFESYIIYYTTFFTALYFLVSITNYFFKFLLNKTWLKAQKKYMHNCWPSLMIIDIFASNIPNGSFNIYYTKIIKYSMQIFTSRKEKAKRL